jgi:TetR/AcrR family transcriptional repressor of nem operon
VGRSSTARERLVDAANQLLNNRGYGSIGVAEICSSAGVRKGSFYHFFTSKQALTLAAIDAHWACQRAVWAATLGGDSPALERIERLIRAQIDGLRTAQESAGVVNGCLFGNLTLELSTQDHVVQRRLEQVFDDQLALLDTVLAQAVAGGEIPPTAGNRATARALLAQLEGMILFAKLANDPAVLDDMWANTLLLLRAGRRSQDRSAAPTNGSVSSWAAHAGSAPTTS